MEFWKIHGRRRRKKHMIYASLEKTPDTAEIIEIAFEKGEPVTLNDIHYTLSDLIVDLNKSLASMELAESTTLKTV